MTNYPYSQQIHDKILNDWKDVPFDEWRIDNQIVSHPSINYKLSKVLLNSLIPDNSLLWDSMSLDHRQSLYDKLMRNQLEERRNKNQQLAARQFLGLE